MLFSYIAKNSHHLGQSTEFFEGMARVVGSWPLAGSSFRRDGARVMEKYCARTILMALGKLMKVLYASDKTQEWLVRWVETSPGDYFKLALLKEFIEAVEVIDSEMGYLPYRTMVYAFQDNVIPLVCDVLMPFFYAMEEGVRVSELSQMQAHLNVTDAPTALNSGRVDISEQLEREIDQVLGLLGRIVEFNYNITYTEY